MTEAGRQNVPLGEAMALTGHRSVQTAVRYFQAGAVEKSQAGNLLGSGGPKEGGLGKRESLSNAGPPGYETIQGRCYLRRLWGHSSIFFGSEEGKDT
jgi:hypothetical protein